MNKIMKNSHSKNMGKKNQNQYTMYQSNHLPMTSQQSRRKSQVSINNMINHQIDPISMNFPGPQGGMSFQGQAFISGMSDTGAAPDNSGGGSAMMSMTGGQGNMHPI
mmetsp:Transcript_16987/g.26166  ORF Transcript_16987/g.26166 Transcript_16987/m.26166 type:complete len:107 (+) Transcript_16987:1868-2188(+)